MQESTDSRQRGMQYLRQAAEAGHKAAMIEVARYLDSWEDDSTARYAGIWISCP